MISLQDVCNNRDIACLISASNQALEVLGYTEHGLRHVGYVSHTAEQILRDLGYPERRCQLAAIAGWVHDVGNCVNRHNHGITGATLLYPILRDIGMPIEELTAIITAVGNHEEQTGTPVSDVSSALIIADKSDAHRTRVRKKTFNPNDIHDRVNYAIKENWLEVDRTHHKIRYSIIMDDSSSVMEFLQIYLSRMQMSESAAKYLGCRFDLVVNGTAVNNRSK